jgi:4-amino-4-deoxy-L-arabinose transferase-like glycosyltransferase
LSAAEGGEQTVERPRAPSTDRDLLFSAYLGLAALLPRLYLAIAFSREPVWDGHYYDFGARRIAAGFGYSDGNGGWHPWCHWPVGYSGLLAAVYRAFGSGPHVATVFGAFVGALLAVFTHRLARYELCRGRARAAGLLCAFYPGLVIYAALVMTETLSALAIVIAGWLWIRDRRHHPRRGAAFFGLAIGAGALVHPSFLAYAPALFLLSPAEPRAPSGRESADGFWHWPSLQKTLAASAIATACAFVPVLPWTLRNCRVMDRCTLLSTNGGWNLAIGSFSRATGRFETLRSSDGCAVVTGQVQQDACWRDLAISTIRADFGRWLALVPKKLGFTFNHESFAIEYLHEADPERWSEDRRRTGRAFLTGAHRIWLTAAALGVMPVILRGGAPVLLAPSGTSSMALGGPTREITRRNRLRAFTCMGPLVGLALFAWLAENSPFYLLAAAIAVTGWLTRVSAGPVTRWALFCLGATLATHAVFFGEDRYHIVVVPMLCLLAARAFVGHAEDTPNAPHL